MKTKLYAFFVFICLQVTLFASDYNFAFNPSKNNGVDYIYIYQHSYSGFEWSSISVGYLTTTLPDNAIKQETFINGWQFATPSIPADAFNLSVRLQGYCLGSAYHDVDASIKLAADNVNWSSPQNVWNTLNCDQDLFTVKHDCSNYYCDITSIFISKRAQGYFNIGAIRSGGYGTSTVALILLISYSRPESITIDNNFTTPNGKHGQVTIDGGAAQDAPLTISRNPGLNLTLGAISWQYDNQGFQRIWHNGTTNRSIWTKSGSFVGYTQYLTFQVTTSDNGKTYLAYLRKNYNTTLQVDKGNSIYIDGQQFSTPVYSFYVVEGYKINLWAPDVIENNIRFFVHHFDYGTYNSSSGQWEWYPTSNQTNAARYYGMPQPYDRNLHFNSYNLRDTMVNVTLYWNQYPNSNVGYQIWRKVYNLNWVLQEGPTLLTTITNYSTVSFSDLNYWIRNSVNGTVNLLYDVRPYYKPSGLTAGSEGYVNISGRSNRISKQTIKQCESIAIEYSLANFPNPFNPITRIEYQLPQAGFVTLKIYNSIGKEIATLVNEKMDEGKYQVEFNGSDLPSGIYFCQFRVNEFVQTRKLMLVK